MHKFTNTFYILFVHFLCSDVEKNLWLKHITYGRGLERKWKRLATEKTKEHMDKLLNSDKNENDDDMKYMNQNKNDVNKCEQNEIIKAEETEDDEDNIIEFNINRSPPRNDKKIKIKMKKTQKFGSAFVRLEKKFDKKITLSFDGEEIDNDWTPQRLIDDFDFEDGDLIDAKYE